MARPTIKSLNLVIKNKNEEIERLLKEIDEKDKSINAHKSNADYYENCYKNENLAHIKIRHKSEALRKQRNQALDEMAMVISKYKTEIQVSELNKHLTPGETEKLN